ncbi:MAG TPA: alginate export family protein [Planctomycetota bacterium]|nr:alginate export family protein [Planctomycetota bacterium]
MRTAFAAVVTLGLVAFLAVPALAGAPAPAPAPAPKAAAPVGPGALFVESEEGAATKLVISGSIRTVWDYTRNMVDFNSENGNRNYREYLDSRVELGFLFKLADNVDVFLQPQANYVWGGRRITSGTDTNTDDLSVSNAQGDDGLRIYQAWVALQPDILGMNTVIKVGRQELELGSEMLVGNNSRYDGLSFDAVRMDIKPIDGLTTTLFGAKVLENDRAYVNGASTDISVEDPGDAYLFGLWNTFTGIADTKIDVYGLGFHSERGQGTTNNTLQVYNEVSLYTIGARLAIKPIELAEKNALDVDLSIEAATQFGRIDDGVDPVDISGAWGLEGEIGLTLGNTPWTPRFALGVALASGDTGDGSTDDHTFQPLFQDTTQRLGDADLVSLSNLKCWFAKASVKPAEILEIGGAFYRFEAMHVETDVGGGNLTQPGNGFAGLAGLDNDVANEVDIYADFKLTRNVSLRAVYAWVDPNDFLNDNLDGNSPASRFFAVLTVKW